MRFQGTNFQSWAEFDLEISGLTVIVGRSSKGKSALFRALRGLFRNELATEYIRAGTDGMSVTATLDDTVVQATRTPKGSTKYQIGETKFAKLGGNVPEELLAFGMNPVRVGDFVFDPIFSGQFNAPFLVDPETTGPTKLNAILGAFASTEKLEVGKKAANLSITHKNSEAKTLAEEVSETERRRLRLEAFSREADALEPMIQALESRTQTLENKAYWVRTAEERLGVLLPLRSLVADIGIPDIRAAEGRAAAMDAAVQATNNYRLLRIYRRTQKAMEDVQEYLPTVERSQTACTAIQTARTHAPSVVAAKDIVERLNGVLIAMEQGFNHLSRLDSSIICVGAIQGCHADLIDLGTRKDSVDAELRQATASLAAQAHVACPRCGHRFDPNCEETCQTSKP